MRKVWLKDRVNNTSALKNHDANKLDVCAAYSVPRSPRHSKEYSLTISFIFCLFTRCLQRKHQAASYSTASHLALVRITHMH